MAISIIQSDFIGVGQIATHCNLPKLKIAINEAILFDLEPILCNLYGAVDDGWTSTEGDIFKIVGPTSYENCEGFQTSHVGLRKILVYFAYARYIVINAADDTANGSVTKTNDWSMPKPLAEIKAMASKYKTMGQVSMEKIEAYILKNRDLYPGYTLDKLKKCGCNGSCGRAKNTKGFGMRSKNIRK